MAESSVRRVRRDPRGGVAVRLPKEIADRLPEECEVEFHLDEESATVLMRVTELQRRQAKLK